MIDQGWRWYVDYLMFFNRLRKFALPMSYLLQKVVVYHFPAQMGESRPRGHYPPTPPLVYSMSAQGEGGENCCNAKIPPICANILVYEMSDGYIHRFC